MSKLIGYCTLLLLLAFGISQCEDITSAKIENFEKLESFEDIPSHLGLTLTVSQQELVLGQELDLQIILTNKSDSLINISLPYYLYNFVIVRSDSTIIWDQVKHDFNGIPIPSNALSIDLNPGESHSFHHTWNQKNLSGQTVASGTYIIMGILDIRTVRPEKFKHDFILIATEPIHITISK